MTICSRSTSLQPSTASSPSHPVHPGAPRALQHLLGAQQLGLRDRRQGGGPAGAPGRSSGRVVLGVLVFLAGIIPALFLSQICDGFKRPACGGFKGSGARESALKTFRQTYQLPHRGREPKKNLWESVNFLHICSLFDFDFK